MRRFNSIKKSRKKSKDIDEKIEYLNKECQKTGLCEIANSTSGLYQGTSSVPNSVHIGFSGASFGGLGLGLSGSDGVGIGGAYVGKVIASEHGLTPGIHDYILNLDGVAVSPPHPISGKRRYASTRTGMVDYSPSIPGKRQGNSSRVTGSVIWLWDANANNLDGTSGNWYPLEFDTTRNQWAFWDTSFLGFGFLNGNLDQLELSGVSVGTEVSNLFNNLNIFNTNNIGEPTSTVFTKNKLGDPGFLPINIPDLTTQAFEYLKGKAQQALEGGKNLFNQAVAGAFPKNPNNNYAPDLAGSIAANEVRTYENEDIPDEQKQNLINNMNWLDIGKNIPITSQPTNYSDDNFYVNDNGDVTPHSGDSKNKFPPNTHTHQGDTKKYGDNPLANAGEFQFELVVPPDGSEPYFNYEDHAYYNPNSKDKGEVPDAVRNALANLSQAAGQQLPGYPDGIKGDVVKKVQIPLSDAIKFNPKIKLAPALSGMFKESLDESVNLGHFDPEVLNVDINDIRKGIMPEFPKDPPPEMISGYSAKSRLAPKTITGEPFIKIKRKDLARNHKLTDKEISEFMSDIEMINEYIKENPAELKYAMIRYPKDDPRLAELNWQMDQKLSASKEYMETHFPENKSLFNKLQQKISNTIGQTDPKNFKDHTPPPQFTDDLDTIKRRKETVSRHFKKRRRKKG